MFYDMENKEIWKDIKNYGNISKYQISNKGRIRTLSYDKTGKIKILKTSISNNGYEQSNYLEIAKKFGVSKNCICTRIHRALKKLRLYYKKIGVDYFGRIR